MNCAPPAISAVIPTHGRTELTIGAIESLNKAALNYSGSFELLIIDSSEPADAQKIESACNVRNVKYVEGPPSVREKRNLGAKLATGDILLFIDSDCIASIDLLNQHAQTYQVNKNAVGVCGITDFTGHRGLHWKIIELSGLADAFYFAQKYDRVQWCTTSNFSIKRSAFWSAGGFDVNFPFRLGGDDLDLTYRVTSKIGPIICNPKAVVLHSIETWASFKAIGERAFRWGRMGYHIFNKHPELQCFDLPKPMLVFLLIAVLIISKTHFLMTYTDLVILLYVVCCYLLVDILFFNKKVSGKKKLLIPFAWIYRFIYRSGLAIEFLRNGDFRFIYQKTIFSVYQLVDEWPSNVHRQWNLVLHFIAGWVIWNTIR